MLLAVPLTWDHCLALAPRISEGDTQECLAVGRTPLQALAGGTLSGQAFAAIRSGTHEPVGAFGFTSWRTIWSLWGEMTLGERRQVLRETREWARDLVRLSGFPVLHNWVPAGSPQTVRWLEASGAFALEPTAAAEPFIRFETLPLDVLAGPREASHV